MAESVRRDPRTQSSVVQTWLSDVLASGLGSPREAVGPLSDEEWSEAASALRAGRIVGLAVHAILGGYVKATEAQIEEIAWGHGILGDFADLADDACSTVTTILDEHGVETRATKGVATSRMVYPEVTWRLYGDADLFVRSDDFELALDVLGEHGFHPRDQSELHKRFWHAVPVHSEDDDDGIEVDLHRFPGMGFTARRLPESIWFEGPVPITVAGRTVQSCSLSALALHACFHACSVKPHLSTARDIAQIAADDSFDPAHFAKLVELARAEAIVGIAAEWASIHVPAATKLADSIATAPRYRRALSCLEFGNGDALVAATGLGIRGVAPRVAFLKGLAGDRGGGQGRRSVRIARRVWQRSKT